MKYRPFELKFEEYLSISPDRQTKLQIEHSKINESWYLSKLDELGADWIMVGGNSGKIYRHGRMNDYPTIEELERVAQETREVPFTFSRPPVSEEAVLV